MSYMRCVIICNPYSGQITCFGSWKKQSYKWFILISGLLRSGFQCTLILILKYSECASYLQDDVLSEYFDVVRKPGENQPTTMFVIKVFICIKICGIIATKSMMIVLWVHFFSIHRHFGCLLNRVLTVRRWGNTTSPCWLPTSAALRDNCRPWIHLMTEPSSTSLSPWATSTTLLPYVFLCSNNMTPSFDKIHIIIST